MLCALLPPGDFAYAILGDLEEEYHEVARALGVEANRVEPRRRGQQQRGRRQNVYTAPVPSTPAPPG